MDRLNREIRRRSNVVGVFPSTNSFLRFSASYLFEYQAEWVTAKAHRQYRSPRSFSSQFIALYSSLFFCLRCQNYTLSESKIDTPCHPLRWFGLFFTDGLDS
ncbi:hypothetical protein EB093_07060 [bacterium]|nr:hypothetical protein [bacterium]